MSTGAGALAWHFRNRVLRKPRWLFVTGGEQWILLRICRELQRHAHLNARFFADAEMLPHADFYFFAHQSRLIQFLARPHSSGVRIVFFPHFEDHGKRTEKEVLDALRQADYVMCQGKLWRGWLLDRGFDPARVFVVLGAADPAVFQPHERGGRTVGFVSKFAPRKEPERIMEVVRRMPDLEFLLIGPDWERYERYAEMQSLPNLRIVTPSYAEYPDLYARMDVFVSPSRVEGGPFPLLEAMMSNVVPVASRTGFAEDLIRDGVNGFLFEPGAGPDMIVAQVRRALESTVDVRATVQHLTWENYAAQFLAGIGTDARGRAADGTH